MRAHATDLLTLPLNQIAVVMVDFQNDFCSPDAGQGTATNSKSEATARRANTFAAAAANLGAHVIYTQQVLDWADMPSRQQRWEEPDGLCALGSWALSCTSIPFPAPPSS